MDFYDHMVMSSSMAHHLESPAMQLSSPAVTPSIGAHQQGGLQFPGWVMPETGQESGSDYVPSAWSSGSGHSASSSI